MIIHCIGSLYLLELQAVTSPANMLEIRNIYIIIVGNCIAEDRK